MMTYASESQVKEKALRELSGIDSITVLLEKFPEIGRDIIPIRKTSAQTLDILREPQRPPSNKADTGTLLHPPVGE